MMAVGGGASRPLAWQELELLCSWATGCLICACQKHCPLTALQQVGNSKTCSWHCADHDSTAFHPNDLFTPQRASLMPLSTSHTHCSIPKQRHVPPRPPHITHHLDCPAWPSTVPHIQGI